MKFIFSPAVRLMARLRYPMKFALIGVLALLTIAWLFWGLASQLRGNINASRAELAGMDMAEPLLKAVQQVQQHRGLSAMVIGGAPGVTERHAAKGRDTAAALATADGVLSGSTLPAVASEWKPLQAEWNTVRDKSVSVSLAESRRLHTDLISHMLGVERRILDDAGLMLDTDADAFYLIDTTLRGLPDMLEQLGRVRALGAGVLAKKQISDEERLEFAGRAGSLRKSLAELQDSLTRSGAANGIIKPTLDSFSGQIGEQVGAVLKIVDEDIIRGKFASSAEDYVARTTAAIDLGYQQSGKVLAPTIRQLIQVRIGRLEGEFRLDAGLALGVALLLLYFAAGAYLAVMAGIKSLSEGAERLAAGDLTARVVYAGKDELAVVAERFNDMAGHFNALIRNVQRGAEDLNLATVELASSSSQVAQGSQRQSEAASGMAAAVEEMTVSVDEISRNAQEAQDVSRNSGKLSAEGGRVVARTVEEMRFIAGVVNDSARVVQQLGERSAEISTMVSSIKEIADQTNLLALNAAIEAARAGETGRGFAVVADEVRKLAERTGRATEEITRMVSGIQSGIGQAVQGMADGVARVQSGVDLTLKAGESMERINGGARQVVQAVEEISLALKEQGAASTDIARNVERIAQMAEENNSAVGQTARTASRLRDLASGLNGDISRFRVA